MVSDAKKLTNARWDRKNTRSITLKCYIKTDQDILDRLDSVPNRNAYIKRLIREDIERNPEPLKDL